MLCVNSSFSCVWTAQLYVNSFERLFCLLQMLLQMTSSYKLLCFFISATTQAWGQRHLTEYSSIVLMTDWKYDSHDFAYILDAAVTHPAWLGAWKMWDFRMTDLNHKFKSSARNCHAGWIPGVRKSYLLLLKKKLRAQAGFSLPS